MHEAFFKTDLIGIFDFFEGGSGIMNFKAAIVTHIFSVKFDRLLYRSISVKC